MHNWTPQGCWLCVRHLLRQQRRGTVGVFTSLWKILIYHVGLTKKNGQKYMRACSSHCVKLLTVGLTHPDSAHASFLSETDWKYPLIPKILKKNKSPQADLPVQETACHVFSEGGGKKHVRHFYFQEEAKFSWYASHSSSPPTTHNHSALQHGSISNVL